MLPRVPAHFVARGGYTADGGRVDGQVPGFGEVGDGELVGADEGEEGGEDEGDGVVGADGLAFWW